MPLKLAMARSLFLVSFFCPHVRDLFDHDSSSAISLVWSRWLVCAHCWLWVLLVKKKKIPEWTGLATPVYVSYRLDPQNNTPLTRQTRPLCRLDKNKDKHGEGTRTWLIENNTRTQFDTLGVSEMNLRASAAAPRLSLYLKNVFSSLHSSLIGMNAAAAVTIFGSNGRAVCAHLLITYSFQKKQIVLPSSAFEAEPPDLSHKKKFLI